MIKRTTEMLQLPYVSKRSVDSLSNWVNGTGSIVRREMALLQSRDLCVVGADEHHGIAWMESLVERIFIYFHQVSIRAYLPKAFRRQSSASGAAQCGKMVFLFEGHALLVISVTALIVGSMMKLHWAQLRDSSVLRAMSGQGRLRSIIM